MRIENIDARGITAENGLFATEGKQQIVRDDKKIEEGVTRIAGSLSVPRAGYDLGSLTNAGSKEEAALMLSADGDKAAMKKMAKLMGGKEYDELKSNDFSPEAMEERRITTVVEKMQLEMAKAGVDISKLASDLDPKDIEAITGSAATAETIETAMKKAAEIADSGELTEGETDYLLSNELPPTIDNVYAAKFSGANADNGRNPDGGSGAYKPSAMPKNTDFEAVAGDAEKIIMSAGLEVTDETIGEARYLFENNLPVTEENIRLLDKIYNEDLINENNAVASAIVDAALEGRNPGDAYMLPGYSAMDKARDLKDFVDNATPSQIAARDNIDDITARRVLEETRLAMSVEANFSLIKRGIAIDTQPLAQVVEELKAQEQEYYSAVFNIGADETEGASEGLSGVTADMIASFNETNAAIDMLKQSPAYTIGRVDIKTATLDEARNVGWDLKDRFDRANDTYEALGTSPRADLGDSMKKAFGNVSDILGEIGMDDTNENRRAVRILAYNRMEINEQSVLSVRDADEMVQRAFKSLTPGVVAQIVKSGVNPLDMTMPELTAKASEIKSEYNIDNDSERFSRFLVKLEQNSEISEEERSAYIGIYRLISRVEAGDGAAIGSLLLQDRDITMRNLMTAVRTGKKAARGFDESVDDEKGYVEASRSELTITQQIEVNISLNQLAAAADIATPATLKGAADDAAGGFGAGGADKLLDMTPEELLTGLEKSSGSEAAEAEAEAYAEAQAEDIRLAAESSDDVYAMLKDLSMPVTVQNLQAAAMIMSGRNKMFADLIARAEDAQDDDPDIRALIEKCIAEFGEDAKTPAQMAEAQEALAELAEHAMDGYITEEEVRAVDLKGMKLTRTVTHFMKEMAKNDSYTLPIKVNDATGNISVKIVHGGEEKGLAMLTFFCENIGDIKGSLHYSPDVLDWELAAEDEAVKAKLEDRAQQLDDILAREAKSRTGSDVTDNDIMRAAGRMLQFLKNIAEEG